jgi:hypothetical protein
VGATEAGAADAERSSGEPEVAAKIAHGVHRLVGRLARRYRAAAPMPLRWD